MFDKSISNKFQPILAFLYNLKNEMEYSFMYAIESKKLLIYCNFAYKWLIPRSDIGLVSFRIFQCFKMTAVCSTSFPGARKASVGRRTCPFSITCKLVNGTIYFILPSRLNQAAPQDKLTIANFILLPKWGLKICNRKPFLSDSFFEKER